MHSFKQALNHIKNHWQQSLILGLLGTLLISLSRFIPYAAAFFISLSLLVLQNITGSLLEGKKWTELAFLNKEQLPAVIITSFILFPTGVLVGSSMELIQNTGGAMITFPTALGLLILSVYFYLVLSHALRLRLESSIGIAKAIDIAGMSSVKVFRIYFVQSFYIAFVISLAGFTYGAGFILALPLLFYCSHFTYLEVKAQGLLK